MSFAPVFGEITPLAWDVSVDEKVSGRTEVAGAVGDGRLGHVLRAVATFGGEFREDALVSGEAHAVGDVVHAQLPGANESLVLPTERRTRCALCRVCHASVRDAVVVHQRVPVVDAEPPAVRAVLVAFALLKRALHAPPAQQDVTDGARLLSGVAHALEDRDCRRPHGGVALEHHARRVVGRSRGDVGRDRPEPRLGVRGRVAAVVTDGGPHVWVVATDGARQTGLLAEPVLVVAGRARLAQGPVRLVRDGRAGEAGDAEADGAARLPEQLVPLVLRALLARGRARRGLVAAPGAGGALLAVSRRRVRRLEVAREALGARSGSARTRSGARAVDALRVARRGRVRLRVAHARGGRGARGRGPRALSAGAALPAALVRARRALRAPELAGDVLRDGVVAGGAAARGRPEEHARRGVAPGELGTRVAGAALPEVVSGAELARGVRGPHVRGGALAGRGRRARLRVLGARQAGGGVHCVRVHRARQARRVARERLDVPWRARRALEVH